MKIQTSNFSHESGLMWEESPTGGTRIWCIDPLKERALFYSHLSILRWSPIGNFVISHRSKTSASRLWISDRVPVRNEAKVTTSGRSRKLQACEAEISRLVASRTASRYSIWSSGFALQDFFVAGLPCFAGGFSCCVPELVTRPTVGAGHRRKTH